MALFQSILRVICLSTIAHSSRLRGRCKWSLEPTYPTCLIKHYRRLSSKCNANINGDIAGRFLSTELDAQRMCMAVDPLTQEPRYDVEVCVAG